jgi:hypothetical protein
MENIFLRHQALLLSVILCLVIVERGGVCAGLDRQTSKSNNLPTSLAFSSNSDLSVDENSFSQRGWPFKLRHQLISESHLIPGELTKHSRIYFSNDSLL